MSRTFSRVGMTADPKLAAAYLTMANHAGVGKDEPFHVVLNEGCPTKEGAHVIDSYLKQGEDAAKHLPSQIRYMGIAKMKNGEDGTVRDASGGYQFAMTPGEIENQLDHYAGQRKQFKTAFSRSEGATQKVRNEASVNIIQTLLTSENQSWWFDAVTALDVAFDGPNRLAPNAQFGFFSDQILAANSRFAGAGQNQGTTNSAIAEQQQQVITAPLNIDTKAIKLAPDPQGSMNPYISAVLKSGGRQMISANAGTKQLIEYQVFSEIMAAPSVLKPGFASILSGVSSPADLNGSNIFQFMQNLGLKLKLFAADGLNARGKDLIVPVEDYWVLTSTLVAAFSSGASQNFGFAMTPLQYLEETLRINVVPSNNLGDGAGQLKTWMISSEAIQNPNQHPTYGLMHVDEGSLYYGYAGLNFTVPQTAPVHASRFSEVAFYRRASWMTLSW